MSLVLTVDTKKFDAHLNETLRSASQVSSSIQPVLKGNGYGFGLCNLARKTQQLGVARIAIGTIFELAEVREFFTGEIVVLEPLSAHDTSALKVWQSQSDLTNVIATVSDASVLKLDTKVSRVLIEGQTSMLRFGFRSRDLISNAAALSAQFTIEGLSLHSSLAEPVDVVQTSLETPRHIRNNNRLAEVVTWLNTYESLALQYNWQRRVSISHLPLNSVRELHEQFASYAIDLRMGTKLWLGAPKTLHATGSILAINELGDHTHVGYRQVDGHGHKMVIIVSGGTAHGVAMSSPTHTDSLRKKAVAMAEGLAQVAGKVRSPFHIDGDHFVFAEPPHMHVSMLWTTRTDLAVGQQLEVNVRNTTTNFDEVIGLF